MMYQKLPILYLKHYVVLFTTKEDELTTFINYTRKQPSLLCTFAPELKETICGVNSADGY